VDQASDDVQASHGYPFVWRLIAEKWFDPKTGELLAERNDMLDHELVRRITSAGIAEVMVRSR